MSSKKKETKHYTARLSRIEPTDLEVKILTALALKKHSYHNKLLGRRGSSKIATQRGLRLALRRLKQKRLITFINAKGVREKKPFQLTTYGLFMVLYYQDLDDLSHEEKFTLWPYIGKLATVHGYRVPLIFGKWSFFKEEKIDNFVFDCLRSFFASEAILDCLFYQELGLAEEILGRRGVDSLQRHEKRLVDRLTGWVLLNPATMENDLRLALLKDPEIKSYIRLIINSKLDYHTSELYKLSDWKSTIEKIS